MRKSTEVIIVINEKNQTIGKGKVLALTHLWGLTLLERSLNVLKEAGLSDFSIVCGSQYNAIQSHVKSRKLSARFNLSLFNDFEDIRPKGNKFLVLNSNIMFDAQLIERTLARADGNLTIYVDSSPKYVKSDQELPEEIITPGIFLCNREDLSALKSFVYQNTIPQEVVSDSKIQVHDLKGSDWYRINTQHDSKMAEQILLNKNMSYLQHEAFGMILARKLSARFVLWCLVRTSLTPNQVSFTSFLLLFIVAFLFSFGTYLFSLIGVLVLLLALSLDYCDGMLARLKFNPSKFGKWLEDVLATLSFSAVVFGAMLGIFNRTGSILPWFVGFAVIVLVNLDYVMNSSYKQIFGKGTTSSSKLKGTLMEVNNLCRIVDRPYILIIIGAVANIMLYSFVVLIIAIGIPMSTFFISAFKKRS